MAPSLTISIRISNAQKLRRAIAVHFPLSAVCSFTSQYPFNGFQQILGDVIWLSRPISAPGLILFTSVPGHHQYAPRSHDLAGFDVPMAVSDGVAPAEIEIEIPGRPPGQSGLRFAAIAI